MSQDRYEIRGKLGQGGIGAVYRAYDKHLNREVAIKRIIPDESEMSAEDAKNSLLKEAKALSALQHPHIVTVYDVGADDDEGAYVVMEILEGRTIEEMVSQGTLVWEDFREVVMQTMEAMIAAQDMDLVHRDLKPANIMVVWLPSGKFQIKLLDFGLAKFSPTPSLQTMDHGHSVFGSIYFMAPEQFERRPLDGRTDLYALGCIYYYTLTGQYPFDGDSAPQVMAAHLQHTLVPLSEQRPDLPKWACDWVMWLMERNMDYRPLNAREALRKFLELEKQGDVKEVAATVVAAPVVQQAAPQVVAAVGRKPATLAVAGGGASPLTRAGQLGGVISGAKVSDGVGTSAAATVSAGVTTAPLAAGGGIGQQGAIGSTRVQLPGKGGVAAVTSTKKPLTGKVKMMIAMGGVVLLLGGIVAITTMTKETKQANMINYADLVKKAVEAKRSGNDSKVFASSPEEINLLLSHMGKASDKASSSGTEWQGATLYVSMIDPKSVEVAEVVFDGILSGKYGLSTKQVEELLRYISMTPALAGQAKGNRQAHENFLKIFAKDEATRKYIADFCKRLFTRDDFEPILDLLVSDPKVPHYKNILIHILKYESDTKPLAAKALDAFKKAKSPDLQGALMQVMAASATEEGFKAMKPYIAGNDVKLRSAALEALSKWSREDDAMPELLRMYDAAKNDTQRGEVFFALLTQLNVQRPDATAGKMLGYMDAIWSKAQSYQEKRDILLNLCNAYKEKAASWVLTFGENKLKELEAEEAAGAKDTKIVSAINQAEDLVGQMKRLQAGGQK